jgi:hypothetical protein
LDGGTTAYSTVNGYAIASLAVTAPSVLKVLMDSQLTNLKMPTLNERLVVESLTVTACTTPSPQASKTLTLYCPDGNPVKTFEVCSGRMTGPAKFHTIQPSRSWCSR